MMAKISPDKRRRERRTERRRERRKEISMPTFHPNCSLVYFSTLAKALSRSMPEMAMIDDD